MADPGDALAEFAGRDRQPFSRFAVKQHAIEIAFESGEEDVVQRGDTHGVGLAQAPLGRGKLL